MSLELESEAEEGPYGIVFRALAKAHGESKQAVASLDLTSLGSDSEPQLEVEASFGLSGTRHVLTSLGVRASWASPEQLPSSTDVADLMRRFGGTQFTNLCASPPGNPAMELDVTISFPGFRYLASNLLLAPTDAPSDISTNHSKLLTELGARPKGRRGTLHLPRHCLRAPMTYEQQLKAYELGCELGWSTSMYTATIPATQTARVEVDRGATGEVVAIDYFAGRGLSGSAICTEHDAEELATSMQRSGVKFGGRRYQASLLRGEAGPVVATRPRRGGIKFSFWIKG